MICLYYTCLQDYSFRGYKVNYKVACIFIFSLITSLMVLMDKWQCVALLILRFWFSSPGQCSLVLVIIAQNKHFVFQVPPHCNYIQRFTGISVFGIYIQLYTFNSSSSYYFQYSCWKLQNLTQTSSARIYIIKYFL